MWRNVSWNSTESTLPEGLHKHETGAYFKTPSIQSATSSQSGGNSSQSQAQTPSNYNLTNNSNNTNNKNNNEDEESHTSRSIKLTEEPEVEEASSRGGEEVLFEPASIRKRQRLKESRRQMSASVTSQQPLVNKSSSSLNPQAPGHVGFRSRLSSISGALQHPKIAKRLFSGANQLSGGLEEQPSPIQITTTSIDSPQHQQSLETAHHQPDPVEPRLSSHSSGRRLSQLFLPQQLPANPMLIQDPYGNGDLIPPHLLGLYGQPPLVAGNGAAGMIVGGGQLGHRASWADISLFGRLSNVRPSIDSAFHSCQMRHSFDARKLKV